ncbi:methyltransferase domain-containing protein [Oceanirhabdus sp. W0125-5]|uniref:methyltransferase domain-containing protein n=1 Tax=Oceanirhabdus sp. W0125-5 TaxID=2999116 RepID=UPI0022F342D5|nr:methyltransferase domain-containing protein [Oceanirhabdus sp. W0125-5]WBW97725.1 methyltransferase domain-containing protein [Oceanirhabdus sp. W0125-5]
MDWQKRMNQAMEYIENNLSEKIEYNLAAQFMNCSEWEFRRIFSFLAQIPLSEYVRCRRLTMAAFDIQKGAKIIEVAQRYGYESQAAFSRAFSKLHGFSPSLARDKGVIINPYPRLTFKLVLMEGIAVEKDSNQRASIIGGGDVGFAILVDNDQKTIHKTNEHFWNIKGNDVIGTMALPLYGAFISEEKCQLLGDISDQKVLEIGCGTGRSLQYIGEKKASELWGIDISNEQIEKAKEHLASCNLSANLICSPMEEECGIPRDYFDVVYSVYGIGWTTDLEGTFERIASYLKKDGVFIFSWSHPIHKCVAVEGDMLSFKKCYFDESWYSVSLDGDAISLSDRKLSTYVNALAKSGFIIEEMIEESQKEILESVDSKFAQKAKMLPVTFVIKARKR